MVIFYVAYGSDFFVSVFAAPRLYDLQRLPGGIKWLITPLLLFIGVSIAFSVATHTNIYTRLVGLYVFFSGIWGIFILGGEGVDRNAMFDLIIAVTAATGLAVQYVNQGADRKLSRPSTEVTAILVLSLPLLIMVPDRISTLKDFIETMKEQEALTIQDVAYIAAQDGPVMCTNLAYCYWAGKNFEVDLSNLRRKLRTGILPESDFVALFDDKYFALIETYHHDGNIGGVSESVDNRVRANYNVRQPKRESGAFLVPRGSE
jgi:hypothetical protein